MTYGPRVVPRTDGLLGRDAPENIVLAKSMKNIIITTIFFKFRLEMEIMISPPEIWVYPDIKPF